jgi:hypothetical protein
MWKTVVIFWGCKIFDCQNCQKSKLCMRQNCLSAADCAGSLTNTFFHRAAASLKVMTKAAVFYQCLFLLLLLRTIDKKLYIIILISGWHPIGPTITRTASTMPPTSTKRNSLKSKQIFSLSSKKKVREIKRRVVRRSY